MTTELSIGLKTIYESQIEDRSAHNEVGNRRSGGFEDSKEKEVDKCDRHKARGNFCLPTELTEEMIRNASPNSQLHRNFSRWAIKHGPNNVFHADGRHRCPPRVTSPRGYISPGTSSNVVWSAIRMRAEVETMGPNTTLLSCRMTW
jgi:hypothetical protein